MLAAGNENISYILNRQQYEMAGSNGGGVLSARNSRSV